MKNPKGLDELCTGAAKWLALAVYVLIILVLLTGLVSAERRAVFMESQADGFYLQALDLKTTIKAQEELLAAYEAQNVALADTLTQVTATLEAIAYGPFSRVEIQELILQVTEVIQQVNQTLLPDEAQEIGRIIVHQAAAAEVDPWLLLAIAITESHCRPAIRGGSGEYGMMQVMPGTGQWIAGRLGYTNWSPEELWHIETNVQFAAYYLRTSIREFGGNLSKGILAYNRGSTGARAWLQENIAEEHRYVRKVNSTYGRLANNG